MDARKSPLSGLQALTVLEGVDEVYAVKGRKVVHVDLRTSAPPAAELTALLVGPTGNLRAPTLRRGRTLLVGFDEAIYRRVLAPGRQ